MNPSDPITILNQIQSNQRSALTKLGITTLRDLLFHFPTRYGNIAQATTIDKLNTNTRQQIYGRVKTIEIKKSFRGKIPMAEAIIEDDTGTVKAVWFHQPYIAKTIKDGSLVRVEGEPQKNSNKLSFVNPDIKTVSSIPTAVGDTLFTEDIEVYAQPIYPESQGISSLWLYHAIQKVLRAGLHERITDPLPSKIRERYNLPDINTALVWVHSPKKKQHAESARKRFSFEEIFYIQCAKQQKRHQHEQQPTIPIKWKYNDLKPFINQFSFTPTQAQIKTITHILSDMRSNTAMSRLLEGDVGSGKTFVAAATAYAVVHTRPEKKTHSTTKQKQKVGNIQVGYMAPTEVLAHQHFESFIEMFTGTGIQIGLITSHTCRKFPSKIDSSTSTRVSKKQLLQWVANGEIPILIGTHSLIQDTVQFKNLGYVIVDEQHRFGTSQRARLHRKDAVLPHFLSMTATPIPRTLALTIYGDLDISLLDEQPKGRKHVVTQVVTNDKRSETYEAVRKQLAEGRQAYIIVPRINPPDETNENALRGASVTDMQPYLQKDIFPDYTVEGLHSKMTPTEKNTVMERFAKGAINVLVSTSVVEVGVSVANATTMIIENAERFGLAQLHQFRGRIMRSNHQSYCYVFSSTGTLKTKERLKALTKAKNGFDLAEYDLAQRGAGELAGRRQSGISDIGMEAIKNIKMVEAAREEARTLITLDPTLKSHPSIKQHVEADSDIHFE